MVTSGLTDSDVLAIWKRMEFRRRRVRVAKAEFRVGQHVLISNEKIKFAYSAEQNFSTEIFRIAKILERRPSGYFLASLERDGSKSDW